MDINNINRLLIFAWGGLVPVSFSDERVVRTGARSGNYANFRHSILPGIGRLWERLPGGQAPAPGNFDRTHQSVSWQLKWEHEDGEIAYQGMHNTDDRRREIQWGVRSSIDGGVKISHFPADGRFLVGGTRESDGSQILFDPAIGGVHDDKHSAYQIGNPGAWQRVITGIPGAWTRHWNPIGTRIQARMLPEDWDVVANPSPALSDFSDWTTIMEVPFSQAHLDAITIDTRRRASYGGEPVYNFEEMLKIPMITLTAGPPE